MLKQSTTLLAKKRRSFLTTLRHRWMMKLWSNFNGAGQEHRITFDTQRDLWLTRLDTVEGEAQAGRYDDLESDQFNADYIASRYAFLTTLTPHSPQPTHTPTQRRHAIHSPQH